MTIPFLGIHLTLMPFLLALPFLIQLYELLVNFFIFWIEKYTDYSITLTMTVVMPKVIYIKFPFQTSTVTI